MNPDKVNPGIEVVHLKIQVIGKIVEANKTHALVKLADRLPTQYWNLNEIDAWEPEAEMRKLSKLGFN